MNSKPSTPGSEWCTAALDPFHDYTHPVPGLPDDTSMPSFVRQHVQTMSFAATATGDNFRVSFNGLDGPVGRLHLRVPRTSATTSVDSSTATIPISPIDVLRSDGNHVPCYGSVPATATRVGGFALTPDLVTPHRVIALGLEIHDTTAQLNRQGTISCLHVPGCPTENQFFGMTEAVNSWSQSSFPNSSITTPALPATIQSASIAPGYVEWESSKGAYIVGRMISAPKPYALYSRDYTGANYELRQINIMTEGDSVGQEYYVPRGGDVTTYDKDLFHLDPSHWTGFQPFTIFISGVSATSSYRLTLRTFVEYFPRICDSTVLPNAICPPSYDPQALVTYHQALSALPAAVPVSMNEKGDWWKMVLKAIRIGAVLARTAIPMALTALGHPVAAAAATSIGTILSSVPRGRSTVKNVKKRSKSVLLRKMK